MKTIKGKFNEAIIYATTIEASCEAQVQSLCNESWMQGSKIRIMPDCHSGKGCVIGTTITIKNKIVPNLVGVDIGCGVLCVTLGNTELDLAQLDKTIKRNIPMGFNHNRNLKDTKQIAKELVDEFFEIDETLIDSNPDFIIQ